MTVGLLSFATAAVVPKGLTISLTFEPDAAANSSLVTAANSAAAQIMAVATNVPAMTAFITIGYGTIGGSAGANGSAMGSQSVLQTNQSSFGTWTYAQWLTWLQASKNTPEITSMVNALPAGANLQGTSSFFYSNALGKLIGVIPSTQHLIEDGYIGVGTSFGTAQWIGGLMHEMTEVLGRTTSNGPVLFSRFTSAGTWLLTNTATTSYFSVDGGTTKLADFSTSSDAGDFLSGGTGVQDIAISPATDPFDAFVSGTQLNTLSAVDIKALRVMGYW